MYWRGNELAVPTGGTDIKIQGISKAVFAHLLHAHTAERPDDVVIYLTHQRQRAIIKS
jgi:hypothetical protein